MNDIRPKQRQDLESYLLPVLLTLLLILTSVLLGLIDVKRVLPAAGILGLIIVVLFGGQLAAARVSRASDREALFGVLTMVAMADRELGAKSGVMSEQEVIALESCASEVWIYAYDLAWENDNSPFTRIVHDNVEHRQIPYRYLLPDANAMELRAEQVAAFLGKDRKAGKLVKFKMAARNSVMTEFGVTIYNPTLNGGKGNGRRILSALCGLRWDHALKRAFLGPSGHYNRKAARVLRSRMDRRNVCRA
jgi:hypothetical protein